MLPTRFVSRCVEPPTLEQDLLRSYNELMLGVAESLLELEQEEPLLSWWVQKNYSFEMTAE